MFGWGLRLGNQKKSGGSGGTAPVNTVAPTISANAVVGQTITSTNGTWTGTATITFTYQWYYADTSTSIVGATSSTYVVQSADLAHTIKLVVTGTNGVGNSSANSNTSAFVVPSYMTNGASWGLQSTTTSNQVYVNKTSYATIAAAVTASVITASTSVTNVVTSTGSVTSIAANTIPMVDLGALIEPAHTNYIKYSAGNFNTSPWFKNNMTVADNTIVAPDGTTTAATLTTTATGINDNIYQTLSGITSSASYSTTFSVWLKVPSGTLSFGLSATSAGTPSIATTSCALTTTWQRFSVTLAAATASPGSTMYAAVGQGASYTSGQVIHVWGVNYEQNYESSYIGVGSSTPVTRANCVITVFPPAATYNIVVTLNDSSTEVYNSQVVTSSGWAIPTRTNGLYVTLIVAT